MDIKQARPIHAAMAAALALAVGLAPAAFAVPRGQVAWSRTGSVIADASGRVYLEAAGALSRLDPATGRTLWTRSPSTFIELLVACGRSDQIVLRDGRRLLGLDPALGTVRWSRDLSPILGAQTSYEVGCATAGARAYVSFRNQVSGQLASVDLQGGTIAWQSASDWVLPEIVEVGDAVVAWFTSFSGSQMKAFDRLSGRARWDRTQENDLFLPFAANSRLLLVERLAVSGLDLTNGGAVWQLGRVQSALHHDVARSYLYVQDLDQISRLDPTSGAVLWSKPAPVGDRPQVELVLRDGTLGLRRQPALDRTEFSLVDKNSGQIRWLRTVSSEQAALAEDRLARVYVLLPDRVHRLVPSDGRRLWTYARPKNTAGGFDEVLAAGKVDVFLSLRDANTGGTGLVAVDAERGTTIWRWASPSSFVRAGADVSRIFINGADGTARAIQK